MATIVLASASPRRYALMASLGVEFEVCVSDFEEVMDEAKPAEKLAAELATGKALSVARNRPLDIVIGADTFAVFEGNYLGKQASAAAARQLLQRLSGQVVAVYTGLAVVSPRARHSETVVATALIKVMNEAAIDAYIAKRLHEGKASAISIEIIDSIDGPTDAVLGLPLDALCNALKRAGVVVA